MQTAYTKAVIELIAAGRPVEEVFAGLEKALTAKGHTKLYPSVLRAVLRVLDVRDQGGCIILASLDDEKSKKLALQFMSEQGVSDYSEIKLDQNLIGGYIVEANHQRVDASYKRALHKLYQNITT